jgi:hypothetical protein
MDSVKITSAKSELRSRRSSKSYWFGQGFGIALILVAALNAASYFFRSSSIEPLFEGNTPAKESIGLPFVMWDSDEPYQLIYESLLLNLLVGAAVGIALGGSAVRFSQQFRRWVEDFEANNSGRTASMQFSMRGIMGATGIIALLVGGLTQWAGSRELLWFVYLAGPSLLIGIAFLPQRIRWQSRCVIVAVTSVIVIGGAIGSGTMRGMEFDRVMMGIFVFWTPQSAFAAVLGLGFVAIIPNLSNKEV